MNIFVLIPVFNRLSHTQKLIESLRSQTLRHLLTIIVINDGSTDGTSDYLATQDDIKELKGNGSLWWGGAIQMGLAYAAAKWGAEDYVLFLNNDTWFDERFVEILVKCSVDSGGAAVGSAIHEIDKDPHLVSIGVKIDIGNQATRDLLNDLPETERRSPKALYRVDALSGRGTLYPAILFERHGFMRTKLLPHYFSDYEIAMRFKRAGVALLASTEAFVYSPPVYGNAVLGMNRWQRMFSQRSSVNIIRHLFFYMLVGSPLQRTCAPFKMVYLATSNRLKKIVRKMIAPRRRSQ